MRQVGMSDDGAHTSPGSNVDVNGTVRHNSLGLKSVMINHSYNTVRIDGGIHLRSLLVIDQTNLCFDCGYNGVE